jgi:hypothetical protein
MAGFGVDRTELPVVEGSAVTALEGLGGTESGIGVFTGTVDEGQDALEMLEMILALA